MAKSTQLVSQHLENISSDALEKYQEIIRNYVRGSNAAKKRSARRESKQRGEEDVSLFHIR